MKYILIPPHLHKTIITSLIFLGLTAITVGAYVADGHKVGDGLASAQSNVVGATDQLPVVEYSGQSAGNGQPLSPVPTNNDSAAPTSPPQTIAPAPGPMSATTPAEGSGITGHVYVAAGCVPPKECPDFIRTYQATIEIESQAGNPITSVTSANDGTFTVTLNPGTYMLVPQYYDSGKITAQPQTVTVAAHAFTAATITYHESL